MIEHLLGARWWWSPVAAAWVVIAGGLAAALPDLGVMEAPPAHTAMVDVVDLGASPHNGVTVEGCGNVVAQERLNRNTYRFLVDGVSDDCAIRAVRWDGVMPAASPSAVIHAGATRTDVTLTLPRWRAGGLGVTLRMAGDGVFVSETVPGLGAERVGVRPGERIVAVDGMHVEAMGVDEFRHIVAGPVGEPVEVTLGLHDRTRTVSVPRGYLAGDR